MAVNIASILETHKHFFFKKGFNLCYQQKKAYKALALCRTGRLGKVHYKCGQCQKHHTCYCSCSNRHCPQCQGHKTKEWVKDQERKKLPVEYFMVTFTIPSELRALVMRLQAKAYQVMFNASSEVIKEMMGNPKHLGVNEVGFTSILHTWGSQNQYHPHIHIILPGGGLTKDGVWKSFKTGFGLPVRAASKLWQGKILKGLELLVGRDQLPSGIASIKPIVHCKSVGNGTHAIKYLARYVYRVAISNERIISHDNFEVTFKYKQFDKKQRRMRKMTLNAHEFIRRFMQHILPRGFVKVRHYGFNHPNSRIDLDELRLKIMDFSEMLLMHIREEREFQEKCNIPKGVICRHCNIPMKMVHIIRIEKVNYPLLE